MAFVEYFWETYNYAYATYDTGPLEAISAPTCKFCRSLIADVKRIENQGASVFGFEISVLESTTPKDQITSSALVVSSLQQKPGESITDQGAEELPGFKSGTSSVSLAWKDQRWLVSGVANDAKTRIPWSS